MEEFCVLCGGPVGAGVCTVCGNGWRSVEAVEPVKPAPDAGRRGGAWKTAFMIGVAAAVLTLGVALLRPQAVASTYPESVIKANDLLFKGLKEHEGGNTAAAMRLWRQAVGAFERALDMEPGDLQSRSDVGLLHFYLGEAPRALQAQEQVLERDGKYLLALFNLGWMHRTMGDEAKAKEYMGRYLAAVEAERQVDGKYRDQQLIDRQIEAAREVVEGKAKPAEAPAGDMRGFEGTKVKTGGQGEKR